MNVNFLQLDLLILEIVDKIYEFPENQIRFKLFYGISAKIKVQVVPRQFSHDLSLLFFLHTNKNCTKMFED